MFINVLNKVRNLTLESIIERPINSLIRLCNGDPFLPDLCLSLHQPEESITVSLDDRIKTEIKTLLAANSSLKSQFQISFQF